MRPLLLIFFVFAGFTMTAQTITFNPDSLYVELAVDDRLVDAKFDLFNTTSSQVNFLWGFDRVGVPDEWVFQICDKWVCYPPGTEEPPQSQVNDISGQDSIANAFKVTLFNSNGVEGRGYTPFWIYDVNDPTVELGRIHVEWNVMAGGTATFDIVEEQIHVFPNPAEDFFKVSDNPNISSITLYDFLGRSVNEYNYSKNAQYDLLNVEKGIYYVACYDDKGETLSTKRLMKN